MVMRLLLGGQQIDGLLRANVVNTNYFSCDTFSFTVAAGSGLQPSFDKLSEQATGNVELSGRQTRAGSFSSLITGTVDRTVMDPILGTFYAEGRDLSAALIDSYVQKNYVNQSASEVVAAIAQQHGLTATVEQTQGNIGRYYADGYSRLSLGDVTRLQSNWDLVVDLARERGFDVYVSGSNLYFGPSHVSTTETVELTRSDLASLQFEQTLLTGSALTVAVQTWDSQKANAYRATASDASGSDGGSGAVERRYLFSQPNLTPAQADAWAATYAKELTRLRTVVRASMPWDLRIAPRSLILLNGTNTANDGFYLVDCVERSFCSVAGSMQFISAVAWSL